MALVSKKRSPYDKIIKSVLDRFHQEMAPVHDVSAKQEKIIAQNEKITEFLRQIWDRLEHRDAADRN
ncbi:MAG: hypothetical protein P4N41_00265 [Negativicutes bacterium]|nr:hypothetical protein [Negativicutes bacterium]